MKNYERFHFDKVIYADRMLEANQGRIEGTNRKTADWQVEAKDLRKQLQELNQDPITDSLEQTSTYMKRLSDSKVTSVSEPKLASALLVI